MNEYEIETALRCIGGMKEQLYGKEFSMDDTRFINEIYREAKRFGLTEMKIYLLESEGRMIVRRALGK